MPLDQPGSLLSLRLVRIPQLRGDNGTHHFLSSRQHYRGVCNPEEDSHRSMWAATSS